MEATINLENIYKLFLYDSDFFRCLPLEFPIDNICNAVERSNNLKKKARIVEGSRTRVEPDEAELLLKSGELILCIVGIYHLLKGWDGHGSPINLSDVRLIRPA